MLLSWPVSAVPYSEAIWATCDLWTRSKLNPLKKHLRWKRGKWFNVTSTGELRGCCLQYQVVPEIWECISWIESDSSPILLLDITGGECGIVWRARGGLLARQCPALTPPPGARDRARSQLYNVGFVWRRRRWEPRWDQGCKIGTELRTLNQILINFCFQQ